MQSLEVGSPIIVQLQPRGGTANDSTIGDVMVDAGFCLVFFENFGKRSFHDDRIPGLEASGMISKRQIYTA